VRRGGGTDVLEELLPDVFGPMRGDRVNHKSLDLDPVKDKILVHADVGSSLTVCISSSLELIETSLEGKLIGGAICCQHKVHTISGLGVYLS
jgi:hypothetical protein